MIELDPIPSIEPRNRKINSQNPRLRDADSKNTKLTLTGRLLNRAKIAPNKKAARTNITLINLYKISKLMLQKLSQSRPLYSYLLSARQKV